MFLNSSAVSLLRASTKTKLSAGKLNDSDVSSNKLNTASDKNNLESFSLKYPDVKRRSKSSSFVSGLIFSPIKSVMNSNTLSSIVVGSKGMYDIAVSNFLSSALDIYSTLKPSSALRSLETPKSTFPNVSVSA